MEYRHDTDRCFADAIGAGGLDRAAFDAALGRCDAALGAVRAAHDDGSLPLLRLPAARDDLASLRPVADRLRGNFSDVVILGTGGSSLGGQTLYALADRGFGPPPGAPRQHFMDNVDPDTFTELLARLDLAATAFIVISKSGGTTETLTQFLICLDAVTGAVGAARAAEHFVVITEPRDNPLRRLADGLGLQRLDHDPGVGGRFSALSLVGLLPAKVAGLNAAAVRDGAAAVLHPVLAGAAPRDVPAAVGAAISMALGDRGIGSTVLIPYVDRLADFGLWYRQLWAESLGKGGHGTTPIRAVGTVDQHSQLQLYLDGPKDKLFTVVMLDCAGAGPAVAPARVGGESALAYLAGKTLGDVMDAEQRATAETLARNGCPTRVIGLAKLDERAMGALMMHFMLETMIAAQLIGVDAFDQPAVEEGKVLTRRYLAGEGEGAP